MTTQTTETSPRARRILQSLGAVLAGFVAVFVLSLGTDQIFHTLEVFPPWGEPMEVTGLYVLALAYRLVYGVAGGWITARLAPSAPVGHALALGIVGLAASIAGTIAMWNFGPHWYPLTLVVTAVPCAWLGGVLHRRNSAAA
jgi:hypothetical protein